MKSNSPQFKGFTLVEVTIALGLISFGLLAIIGIMPTGLEALRCSTQQTIDTQILQQVSSDLVVNSFGNRTAFTNFIGQTTLYFDDDGQLIPSSNGSTGVRYVAVLQNQLPCLPGLSQGDNQSLGGSLKRFGISISRIDIPNAATNSYSLQIAYR